MNNEHNYNWDSQEPWDQEDTYRTGRTNPPKQHGGIIAALLVVVILLCGIVTILGVVNIRLFRQVNEAELSNTLPINFSQSDSTAPEATAPSAQETAPTTSEDPRIEQAPIQITPSQQSEPNLPQADGLSLQQIYESTIDSVVSISVSYPGGSSTGTGVILSADGYVVTNAHVVENARSIQVVLTDGRTVDASPVGMDEISDLAVLRITADNLAPAQLGDSSSLRVGDTVVAIGDPLGIALRGTMTDGIVSAINRDIDVGGRSMNLIQTNAALNSGNSGGPLINCYGQVIGINTMKIGDTMSSAGVEGLGFAIPSNTVSQIVNQLISQGYVSGRPTLGLSVEAISSFYQFYYNFPKGVYITAVAQGSSAEAAGIRQGDILLSLDGEVIQNAEAYRNILYNYAPGDTVTAKIYRAKRQYSVTLTVEEAGI